MRPLAIEIIEVVILLTLECIRFFYLFEDYSGAVPVLKESGAEIHDLVSTNLAFAFGLLPNYSWSSRRRANESLPVL